MTPAYEEIPEEVAKERYSYRDYREWRAWATGNPYRQTWKRRVTPDPAVKPGADDENG